MSIQYRYALDEDQQVVDVKNLTEADRKGYELRVHRLRSRLAPREPPKSPGTGYYAVKRRRSDRMSVKQWYVVFGVSAFLAVVFTMLSLVPFTRDGEAPRKNPLTYVWFSLGLASFGISTYARSQAATGGGSGRLIQYLVGVLAVIGLGALISFIVGLLR